MKEKDIGGGKIDKHLLLSKAMRYIKGNIQEIKQFEKELEKELDNVAIKRRALEKRLAQLEKDIFKTATI